MRRFPCRVHLTRCTCGVHSPHHVATSTTPSLHGCYCLPIHQRQRAVLEMRHSHKLNQPLFSERSHFSLPRLTSQPTWFPRFFTAHFLAQAGIAGIVKPPVFISFLRLLLLYLNSLLNITLLHASSSNYIDKWYQKSLVATALGYLCNCLAQGKKRVLHSSSMIPHARKSC